MAVANEITFLLHQVLRTRYSEISSSTIILLDHLLTLNQEVELIWGAEWSLGKILFLVNRYHALVAVLVNNYALFTSRKLSDNFCAHWFQWQGITGTISFGLSEAILLLRLYALYRRNRGAKIFLTVIWIGAMTSAVCVLGPSLAATKIVSVPLPADGTSTCILTFFPDFLYAFWIPILVAESTFCLFALYSGFKTYSRGTNMLQSGQRIIQIIVRDSLFYFIIMFATYLTNTLLFLLQPISDVESTISWAVAFSCVMSSRLCLNVRGYVYGGLLLSSSSLKPLSTPAPPGSFGRSDIFSDFQLHRSAPIAHVSGHGGGAISSKQDEVELKELTALRMDSGPWQKWTDIGEFPRFSEGGC